MARHRTSYDEPGALDEILELLSLVFPFFREQERAARKLGLRWERCSTPFVFRESGRAVAHVGVLEMPLVTGEGALTAGSVHAVATHPERRRRGHFRSIMEELLPWCDARYETLQLCTDNPEYFEGFGFRPVAEHVFGAPATRASMSRGVERLDDVVLLERLLAARDPVSRRLGVRDRDVFLFNEARHTLHYAPDLDAILSFDVEDGVLKLWDVVATRIPGLEPIVARIPAPFDRVEVHFAPDRLDAALEPVPDPGGDGVLMARGPYPPEGEPFKLPVTARC